jgi:hypothetical protein
VSWAELFAVQVFGEKEFGLCFIYNGKTLKGFKQESDIN